MKWPIVPPIPPKYAILWGWMVVQLTPEIMEMIDQMDPENVEYR